MRERGERATEMSAGCDVIMWRRPAMAVLVLACGTLIYYHCAVRNDNIVALISDLLFVISWALAFLGLIFRFLNLTYVWLPVSLSYPSTLNPKSSVCVWVFSGCLGLVVAREKDWDALYVLQLCSNCASC